MSDIATVLGLSNGSEKEGGKDGKNQKKDTLFGPSIGVSVGGPDWCSTKDKPSKDEDELTTDIVKEWIVKSKEVSSYIPVLYCSPLPILFIAAAAVVTD